MHMFAWSHGTAHIRLKVLEVTVVFFWLQVPQALEGGVSEQQQQLVNGAGADVTSQFQLPQSTLHVQAPLNRAERVMR
jgi:hypothetical protein